MKDMIDRLNLGCVYKARRWSGDTHSDSPSGRVDEEATDMLMKSAAGRIDRLESDAQKTAETSKEKS
jgi:hypothetical protein